MSGHWPMSDLMFWEWDKGDSNVNKSQVWTQQEMNNCSTNFLNVLWTYVHVREYDQSDVIFYREKIALSAYLMQDKNKCLTDLTYDWTNDLKSWECTTKSSCNDKICVHLWCPCVSSSGCFSSIQVMTRSTCSCCPLLWVSGRLLCTWPPSPEAPQPALAVSRPPAPSASLCDSTGQKPNNPNTQSILVNVFYRGKKKNKW